MTVNKIKHKVLHVFSIEATADNFFDGQFRYLVEHGYEIHVASSDSPKASDFAARNHITFHPVEVNRSMSPMADLRTVKALRQYIRQNGFEAVFGHTPKGALLAMLAARLAGVRHRVYYRHGLIYTTAKGFKHWVLKKEEQFVSLLATRIVNVSPSLSALAVKDHLNPARKQLVLGQGTCGGIDTQILFNPKLVLAEQVEAVRSRMGIAPDSLVFGFCGRICNDKGIPELVEAFALFRQAHPECKAKLMLVGRFDTRDGVSEQVKQRIESDKDIITTGTIDRQAIPIYYAAMDVFVFPSHREGFGMSVLEASAMCKPILVSKSHGCIDSIRENVTGLYIPLEAAGICKGMERMMDKEERKRLGEGGRTFVTENFDIRVMWPITLKMYEEVLG